MRPGPECQIDRDIPRLTTELLVIKRISIHRPDTQLINGGILQVQQAFHRTALGEDVADGRFGAGSQGHHYYWGVIDTAVRGLRLDAVKHPWRSPGIVADRRIGQLFKCIKIGAIRATLQKEFRPVGETHRLPVELYAIGDSLRFKGDGLLRQRAGHRLADDGNIVSDKSVRAAAAGDLVEAIDAKRDDAGQGLKGGRKRKGEGLIGAGKGSGQKVRAKAVDAGPQAPGLRTGA